MFSSCNCVITCFSHLSSPSTGRHLNYSTLKDWERKMMKKLPIITLLCRHVNKETKNRGAYKQQQNRNKELTHGTVGNDAGYHSSPSTERDCSDRWAHKSHTPQCWQLPLSQLNSNPTASFIWLHVWTPSRQDFASTDMETKPHTRLNKRHMLK